MDWPHYRRPRRKKVDWARQSEWDYHWGV